MEVHDLKYYDRIKRLSAEELKQEWLPIDRAEADYLLECLPPAAWKDNAFLVGEPMTGSLKAGGMLYQAVCEVDGTYWTRPALARTFDPAAYTLEIRRVIDEPTGHRCNCYVEVRDER